MAALPQPDVPPERPAPLRPLPTPPAPSTAAPSGAADPLAPVVPLSPRVDPPPPAPSPSPSRVQALALLLVLPLALIATVVVILPARPAGTPEVLVVGSVAGTRWAHGELTELGPVVLTASGSADPEPARTEIRYDGPDSRAQAEAVRRSLGTGRLVESPLLEQRFPVIVYLGKDAPDP